MTTELLGMTDPLSQGKRIEQDVNWGYSYHEPYHRCLYYRRSGYA